MQKRMSSAENYAQESGEEDGASAHAGGIILRMASDGISRNARFCHIDASCYRSHAVETRSTHFNSIFPAPL